MIKTLSLLLMVNLFMLSSVSTAKEKVTRVLWDKKPIAVALKLNEERIIHFPTAIRYWLPEFLEGKTSILAANGVLYITAYESFDKTRLHVQSLESQKVYLLDVMANEDYQVSTEIIITDKDKIKNQALEAGDAESKSLKKPDWYIRLTRFAAQTLYAEEHLMPSDKDISRVKINRTQTIPLIRGGDIEATPIGAWRGGGLTITAVRIRNLSDQIIPVVNKRHAIEAKESRFIALNSDLRGHWLAATAQHHYLGVAGGKDDRTTVYLISSRTLMESL